MNKKINHNKSSSNNSYNNSNKTYLITGDIEQSSNLPLTSLIILTTFPLNLLTIPSI